MARFYPLTVTDVQKTTRDAVAVTLLAGAVPDRVWWVCSVLADAIVLVFAVLLLVLCWFWFDPVGLWEAGFDVAAFSGDTFNYIYQEPTTTLGVPKFLFWMIVPIVSVTMAVHAASNLASTLASSAAAVVEERGAAPLVE